MDTSSEHLIFLISQPRSGSTLLQRILGGHPEIHTTAEPWIMLHPFSALRKDVCKAEYDASIAHNALVNFFDTLPKGEDTYFEGIRMMFTYLYGESVQKTGKKYFLDKTPRYYSIIPELNRTFPSSRFIILLRNPLAVLCSIMKTYVKGLWENLYHYRHDLIDAPGLLIDGISQLNDRAILVHYENLLLNPETEIKRICDKIGIEFTPDIIHYGDQSLPFWKYGDKKTVYQKNMPDPGNIARWVTELQHPQIWRILKDYLYILGPEMMKNMNYSFEQSERMLQEKRPKFYQLWNTFPLHVLLCNPKPKTILSRLTRKMHYSG
ncbi:MAG: sulfotransferase [Nitrospirae bacterium]|nr:sulfotransferase [Nitrospirota bacterium]